MSSEEAQVLDPRGEVNAASIRLASRVDSLDGVTLGLLDNSKKNADHLLDEIGDVLADKHDLREVIYKQKDKSVLPGEELVMELAERCDVIVNAYGDCGSCTSWCIYDSVDLETKGIPVATITTDEFAKLGQAEARSLGMPDLPIITIPHPVSDISEQEVRANARGTVRDVHRVLTGRAKELESEFTNKYLGANEELKDDDLYCPIGL